MQKIENICNITDTQSIQQHLNELELDIKNISSKNS